MCSEPIRLRVVSQRTTYHSESLTCDTVDRADGEKAVAAFTASANTRTVLEKIIVYSFCFVLVTPTLRIVCTVLLLVSLMDYLMCCFLKGAFACFLMAIAYSQCRSSKMSVSWVTVRVRVVCLTIRGLL